MKFYAIILLFLYQWVIFRSGYVWMEFQLNREFIAQNLCENKNAPVQVCGGKCYLTKKLKDRAEAPENTSNGKKRLGFLESFSMIPVQLHLSNKITDQLVFTFTDHYRSPFHNFILMMEHPPP